MNVSIRHGALAPKISEQLSKQGFKERVRFEKQKLAHIQNDCDAVNRLKIRGILSDAEVNRARRRINAEIFSLLAPQ